jgi:DNA-binding CsgD family transcriptional regulator
MSSRSRSAVHNVTEDQIDQSAQRRRAVAISKRREAPRFIICDAAMGVLFASPDLEAIISIENALESLKPQCRQSLASRATVFHAYNDETVLRIVPLSDRLFGCVTIFVDTYSHRGSVFEAAQRFGLTKREAEVLQMVIHGRSSLEIAALLFIAQSTVADHTKSVMRKLGVSKRMELISVVYNLQHETDGRSHAE